MLFKELNLSVDTQRALEKQGFTQPTEIQEKTIPLIIGGKDIFGRSKTGSGKTFAFALPALELIDLKLDKNQILIVCPTRELAMQVTGEIRKITEYRENCSISCIYGGASMEKQITGLKKSKIVVGTPGRLMDHLRRKTLRLEAIKLVVLDEADEMLNMGFRDDIETILETVPKARQTVMFSATMSPTIKNITKMYMNDPIYMEIGEENTTLDEIEQSFVRTSLTGKRQALVEIFQKLKPQSSIVFCNTKRETERIMSLLNENGIEALAMHGDMRQNERKKVIDSIKAHKVATLVATDVVARGIDIDDLDYIVNYDLPKDVEYYIHRIGRTGRAGKSGKAITIINSKEDLITLKDYKKFTKSIINENSISEGLSTFYDIVGEKGPAKSVIFGASQITSKTGSFIPFAKSKRRFR